MFVAGGVRSSLRTKVDHSSSNEGQKTDRHRRIEDADTNLEYRERSGVRSRSYSRRESE